MRVAELDMTNSSHMCPGSFKQRTDSSLRTCVRDSFGGGCSSVMFSTFSINYTGVCGRVIGYQHGSTDGFIKCRSIDSIYVDGVSLSHGSPRRHIWTFASATDEAVSAGPAHSCPCIRSDVDRETARIPSFVKDDYFCDTGSRDPFRFNEFYSANPLWDGAGCGLNSTCCSFNTPPWFYKNLLQPTTDDIEMRVCRTNTNIDEDVAIEIVNIYVR